MVVLDDLLLLVAHLYLLRAARAHPRRRLVGQSTILEPADVNTVFARRLDRYHLRLHGTLWLLRFTGGSLHVLLRRLNSDRLDRRCLRLRQCDGLFALRRRRIIDDAKRMSALVRAFRKLHVNIA